MSNQQQFTLLPFKLEPTRDQPVISGQLRAQNNKFMIEFNTVQTQNNIEWPDFTQKLINTDSLRQDELWKRTCFELFVSLRETNEYREFNFSPSGKWNSYDFTAYRQNPENAKIKAPYIECVRSGSSPHLLSVTFPLENLMRNFNSHSNPEIQFSVTAVIQYSDQSYDYYAHKHCGEAPDFHLRNSFDITLLPNSDNK